MMQVGDIMSTMGVFGTEEFPYKSNDIINDPTYIHRGISPL